MAVEDEDDGGRSPAALQCEACSFRAIDARNLAIHLERHRPVEPPSFDRDTGKITSFRCPQKCGRNFTTLTRYRDHVPLCDGQAPIEPFIKNLATGYREGFAICPECMAPFRTPDELAFHLERHREVHPELRHKRTGELLSKACPRGCGRNFTHWKEFEEHKKLCGGLAPLPSKYEVTKRNGNGHATRRKEGVRSMWRCGACARDFSKAGPYAIHMKRKHGRAYQSPVTEPSDEPEQGREEDEDIEETGSVESTGSVFSDLLDKSRELRRKADRLDEIANKIERLFKEAEELM